MLSLTFEAYKNKERIGIEDSILKLWKISGSYQDYGSNFYEVWSETFINCISIMVCIFEATVFRLKAAFSQFYILVLKLSNVYD